VAITIRAGNNYAPGTDASSSSSSSSVNVVRPSSMAKESEGLGGGVSNLYEPLIANDGQPAGGACCGGRGNGSSGGHHQRHGAAAAAAAAAAASLRANKAAAAEEEHEAALAFAERLKHAGVGTLFVLSTGFQLFVGLKVSAYDRFGQGASHSYSLQVAMVFNVCRCVLADSGGGEVML